MTKKKNFLNRDIYIIEKNIKKVNGKIKPYEKNPLTYNVHERLVIIGFFMIILSLYSKFLNVGHWMFTNFDLSSYPPETSIVYMTASILAFMYGYYKLDKTLEFIGLIGIAYTLLFVAGIINTYYYQWVWW